MICIVKVTVRVNAIDLHTTKLLQNRTAKRLRKLCLGPPGKTYLLKQNQLDAIAATENIEAHKDDSNTETTADIEAKNHLQKRRKIAHKRFANRAHVQKQM